MPMTSWPFTHHTEAAFEPIARRTPGISSRAVDNGDSPEQNVGRRLAQCVGEVIEVHVVELGVYGVPGELRVADGHFVAVVRNDGELVGEILFLHRRLYGAVGEPVALDRFQHQPALDEAVAVRPFFGRRGRRQRDRRNLSRGSRGHRQNDGE